MKAANQKLMEGRRFVHTLADELKPAVRAGGSLANKTARVVIKKTQSQRHFATRYEIGYRPYFFGRFNKLAEVELSFGVGKEQCAVYVDAKHPVAVRALNRTALEGNYNVDYLKRMPAERSETNSQGEVKN